MRGKQRDTLLRHVQSSSAPRVLRRAVRARRTMGVSPMLAVAVDTGLVYSMPLEQRRIQADRQRRLGACRVRYLGSRSSLCQYYVPRTRCRHREDRSAEVEALVLYLSKAWWRLYTM